MGKFIIKAAKGGVKFDLVASNGQVIATSEVYTTMTACKNGIASVQKNSVAANLEDQTIEGFEKQKNPKFEIYNDKAGKQRFRLKATNGEIIATGEDYESKANCLKGVESVRKNAPEATIEDKSKE